MSSLKKIIVRIAFLSLCLLFIPNNIWGVIFESNDNIHISNLHNIEEDFYAWGSDIIIDGTIEGDFTAGAYDMTINGEIKNSANVFANDFRETGTINGSLRAFVHHGTISGHIGRSALAMGQDLSISKEAMFDDDVLLMGSSINFGGLVKKNLTIYGDHIFLSGTVDGDVTLRGGNINIIAPAIIKGNLTYTADKKANIDINSGVTILGETKWKQPEKNETEKNKSDFTFLTLEVSKLLAAFILGVILLWLFRRYILETAHQIRTRFTISIATGFLFLIIIIISILILLSSIIFLIIGFSLASGNLAIVGTLILAISILMLPIMSFTTVSGGVLFYCGKIAMALIVGNLLLKLFKQQISVVSRWQLFIGLIILTLAFSIPYVGFLLYLLVSIIGAGGIILGIKYCRSNIDEPPINN